MENDNQSVRNTSVQIASTPQEQLFFLGQFGSIYFWLHVFAAFMMCLLLWPKVADGNIGIFIWSFAVVLLATGYWLINSRFTQGAQTEAQIKRYRMINILLCLAWGLSGLFLFSPDPIAQAIHLCIVMVIALSIWPISIISTNEFYLQLALLLAPVTLMLALQQNPKTNLLCFVVLAFVTIMVLMTLVLGRILNGLFDKEQSLIEKVAVDPVTQLMSSKHFDRTLKSEWRRCARDQQPLSLILVEVEDFREIEAQLDKKALTKYLKTIANCLQSTAKRGSDTLAHYDYVNANFVALLPGTDEEGAAEMARRFQQKVTQAALPNPVEKDQIVKANVGVATTQPVMRATNKRRHAMMSDTTYPASLLKNAKQALSS